MAELLQDLRSNGHTIVIVTHDPEIAGLAQRKIALSHGKVFSVRRLANRYFAAVISRFFCSVVDDDDFDAGFVKTSCFDVGVFTWRFRGVFSGASQACLMQPLIGR